MKYDSNAMETDGVMNDPELADFRRRVLSKPNGYPMFESYIKVRSDFKYAEDQFKTVNPDYPYYSQLKDQLEVKRRALQDAEEMMGESPTIMERFLSAPKILTEPFEKGLDVLKNFLEAPERDPTDTSKKPSLWDVFWK